MILFFIHTILVISTIEQGILPSGSLSVRSNPRLPSSARAKHPRNTIKCITSCLGARVLSNTFQTKLKVSATLQTNSIDRSLFTA